jgi:hypothetical protein
MELGQSGTGAPEFRADAERGAIAIDPLGGAEIQDLIAQIYETPAASVARVTEIIGDEERAGLGGRLACGARPI